MPWTEELGAGYCPWGCKESGTTERLHFHSLKSVLSGSIWQGPQSRGYTIDGVLTLWPR